jgi:hypothetical protein
MSQKAVKSFGKVSLTSCRFQPSIVAVQLETLKTETTENFTGKTFFRKAKTSFKT